MKNSNSMILANLLDKYLKKAKWDYSLIVFFEGRRYFFHDNSQTLADVEEDNKQNNKQLKNIEHC